MHIRSLKTFLFVPANRHERIEKALSSGADAVIVDLEDAIAPGDKVAARNALGSWLANAQRPVFLRINAVETIWHPEDLLLAKSAGVRGIVLPKTEFAESVEHVHSVSGKPVIPIIESAYGLQHVQEIASAPGCARLAFGKLDLAIDLRLEPDEVDRDESVFLPYRSMLVLSSRVAGLPPPVEGVFTDIDAADALTRYVHRAKREGFNGMLLIHPKQIAPVAAAFRPSEAERTWAQRILAAAEQSGGAATVVDGRMVDAPVIERAKRLLDDISHGVC